MQHCVVIDPSLFPSSYEELIAYGNEAITYLAEFLEEIVDQEKLEEEWIRFKFPPTSLDLFKKNPWKFYQQYQTIFPELCKLSEILLVLPVIRAQCEHGFSIMGIVKSNRRNRLSDELLDQLMAVSLHGQYFKDKPHEDHLIAQAIELWHSKKQRYFA